MLEKLLEAVIGLTAALQAHTAALGNASAAPAAAKKAKAAAAEAGTLPAGSTAPNTVTGSIPAGTSNAAPAGVPVGQPLAAASVSAQDAGNAMVQLANTISRDAAVAVLAQFGAQTFAGVKPEQYAAFKAACEAALAPKAPPTGAAGLM